MSKQKSQMIGALRQLVPPDAVIDVGIGMGNGEMHQWRNWEVPLALIVDAEPERIQWTQDWLERYKGWQLATVLLAESVRQQDFFTLSNQAESGVVAVEQLQQIWPNMELKEQQKSQTQCLQDLLSSPSLQAFQEVSCIWGVIDCLPALLILKGAGDELKKWSVLWIRVVLHDVFSDSKQQDLSSLAEVSSFLRPLGYRCIEVVEENHPALGYALFIQDWHKRYDASLLESSQIKKTHQQQLKQLQQTNDLQSNELENYKVEREQQCQQQKAQTRQLENCKSQIMELEQRCQKQEVQVRQLEDYKVQLVGFKQQCQQQEIQTKQLKDYKARVGKLEQQCQQQEVETQQLENYKKQVEEFKQQLQERDYRQKLLDEEFIKAEAQIELIKDVLLKEKSL